MTKDSVVLPCSLLGDAFSTDPTGTDPTGTDSVTTLLGVHTLAGLKGHYFTWWLRSDSKTTSGHPTKGDWNKSQSNCSSLRTPCTNRCGVCRDEACISWRHAGQKAWPRSHCQIHGVQNIILQQGDSTAESRTSLQIHACGKRYPPPPPPINLSLSSSVPALYLGVAMSKRTCGLSTFIPEFLNFLYCMA